MSGVGPAGTRTAHQARSTTDNPIRSPEIELAPLPARAEGAGPGGPRPRRSGASTSHSTAPRRRPLVPGQLNLLAHAQAAHAATTSQNVAANPGAQAAGPIGGAAGAAGAQHGAHEAVPTADAGAAHPTGAPPHVVVPMAGGGGDAGAAEAPPAPGAAARRNTLQTALGAHAANPNDAAAQANAHDAAVSYSSHAGTWGDRIGAQLQKAATVGVGGTMMAFGLGVNAGIGAADMSAAAIQHNDLANQAGWNPGGPLVPLGPGTVALAAAEWVAGAATGAVGNMLGQGFVGPQIARVFPQHAPVAPTALLTAQMQADMNTLDAGSGDKKAKEIQDQQKSVSGIASPENVNIGRASFVVATAARVLAQQGEPEGLARTMLAGAAVSTLAGAAIGAGISTRAAKASVEIPNRAQLHEMAERKRAGENVGLADVTTKHQVNTFYTKHKPPAAPAAAGAETPPRTWAQLGAQTAGNVASWGNRARLLMGATAGKAAASALGAFAADNLPGQWGVTTRAALASAGIYMAIKPWFNALQHQIPAADNRIAGAVGRLTPGPEAAAGAAGPSGPLAGSPLGGPAGGAGVMFGPTPLEQHAAQGAAPP